MAESEERIAFATDVPGFDLGNIRTMTLDALNRVSVAQNPDGRRMTFQFDSAGQNTTLLQGLGSKKLFSYDLDSRLITVVEQNAAGTPIMTMVDTYDAVGNRTSRNTDGVITTWTMDDGYRLIGQQTPSGRATFVYDDAGNTIQKWHEGSNPMTFTVDAANRIVTMLQGTALTSFTFDPTGNNTVENLAGSRTTSVFDNLNRMTGVLFPDGTRATYTLDGDNYRRSKHEPGANLTTFIWDGTDYLMEKD